MAISHTVSATAPEIDPKETDDATENTKGSHNYDRKDRRARPWSFDCPKLSGEETVEEYYTWREKLQEWVAKEGGNICHSKLLISRLEGTALRMCMQKFPKVEENSYQDILSTVHGIFVNPLQSDRNEKTMLWPVMYKPGI